MSWNALDATHDPALTSFVDSANRPGAEFPIQNLPFGVFRTGKSARCGVAIGDFVLDLRALAETGLVEGAAAKALSMATGDTLNRLMSAGRAAAGALRAALSGLLATGSADEETVRSCLVPMAEVEMLLPARVGDYTDFYTSIHHATNIGRLFRPNNPLLPNYRWIPIGYHGRSSSIVASGAPVIRPRGQKRPAGEGQAPGFGLSARCDYELEMGVFIGAGNNQGSPISIDQADQHIFGLCLLNDWSARDLQGWEYQPLGPFLAKNFATTISPWIVTSEALAPFRLPFERAAEHPQPLPYLTGADDQAAGVLDITLEVLIETAQMRAAGEAPVRLSIGSSKHAFWTIAQMVTHHTVNGCNLCPGDLLGTGTLSGPEEGSQGALIEITRGGKQPYTLPNGEVRTFLEDGDCVILRGWCEREGAVRIGLGECRGTVVGA